MKKLTALILVLMLALLSISAVAEQAGDPFADWNKDAPALKALTEYVEDVTNEASPNYIPPMDRQPAPALLSPASFPL